MNEKERKNRDELFRLMRENPDLSVVPMVDGELGGDEYGYYTGAWGNATVDEYLVCERYAWSGQILFKSDDDVFDVLEKFLSAEEFEKLPEAEEECRKIYDALPWTKAIIVYINLPE